METSGQVTAQLCRAVAVLMVAVLVASVMSPVGAAPGSVDPNQAPLICSQGTLTANVTVQGQRHFVRIDVPPGATVNYSGKAQALSHYTIGFTTYTGLAYASNPFGTIQRRHTNYQFGSNQNPQWATMPVRGHSWQNSSGTTAQLVGWVEVTNYYEYPYEQWIPTVTFTVTTDGDTCSSLPTEQVIADQLGRTHDGGFSADPVNTGTGNFTLPELDLGVAGGLGMERTYNAMDDHMAPDTQTDRSGLFGEGWTSLWDVSLRPTALGAPETGLELRLGDGRRIEIPHDGAGGWEVPTHLRAEVVAQTRPDLGDVRELRFIDGRVWTFDLDGRLLEMADDGPNRISVERNASGVPSAVAVETSDGTGWVSGPSMAIHDDNNDGLVDRVSDPGGNQVSYAYEDNRLVSASVPHHPSEYPDGGAPAAVTYVHDGAGRIVEVHRWVDDGPDPIVEVVNTYDAFGRVESQAMPSGEVADFEYGPLDTTTGTRSTTVTHSWPDEPGTPSEAIVYVHDEKAKLIRTIDSTPTQGASDRSWGDGLLLDQTTRREAQWAHAYDDQGRMVQRAIPDPDTGEVGTRDPETGLFAPPAAGDGWGLETFEYCDATDGDPRLRRRTDPTGVVTELRYDAGAATGDPCPEGATVATQVTVAPATPAETSTEREVGPDGRVRTSTDGDGVVTEWVYGDADPACEQWQLCATVVAPGTSDEMRTEYRYDPAGRLTSTTTAASTPRAATTTFAYDPAGRLVSQAGPLVGIDPSHHPVEHRYDSAGRLVCTSDESNPTPAGSCDSTTGSWFYTYDDAGRVETVRGPDGMVALTEYTSAAERRVTTAHGTPDAATTTYLYGPLGRLTTEISPEGVETHFGYDADGNRTTTVLGPDPSDESRTATSVFDLLDRTVERLGPVGAVDGDGTPVRSRSTTTYDKAGRVIETTKGEGDDLVRTWLRYDDAGRLQFEIVDLDGDDAFHDPTSADAAERDPDDRVTEYTYTPGGRLFEIIEAPTGVSTFDWVSGPESAKRPTSHTYDDAGRLTLVSDPLAGSTATWYDAAGRVDRVESPGGALVRWEYDALDRPIAEYAPSPTGVGESVELWSYDAVGRVVEHAAAHDPAESASAPRSTFGYHPSGTLAWVRDPRQAEWGDRVETTFAYDGRGNLVEQRSWSNDNADNPDEWTEIIESWSYDLDDRLVAHTRPGGATTSYGYDPATGWQDSVAHPSGRAETMSRWPSGSVREHRFSMPGESDVVVERWFDSLGRQSRLVDPTGETTYSWDRNGGLTAAVGPDETTTFGYDQHGHRTSIGYPWGFDAEYTLDPLGRPVSLSQGGVERASWTYDADSRVLSESIGPDGSAGEASWVWPTNGAARASSYQQELADNPLRVYELEWDHGGQLVAETLNGTTDTFSYDDANQLVERQRGDEVWSWTYNTRGLITHTSSDTDAGVEARVTNFDADGRPTTATSHWTNGWVVPASYEHDADGRLTTALLASTPVFDASYDVRGLPTEVTTHWDGEARTTGRVYDGDGYLVGLDPGTGMQPITWDRSQAAGDVLATNTMGPREGLVSYLQGPSGAVGVHYGAVWLGGVNRDPQGSSLNHIDLDGYDPWGKPEGVAAPARFGLGYRGELTIDGIVHLRNRDYHPGLNTFTTPDPLSGVPATPTINNRYHYADNNPLNRTDPLGLRADDSAFGLLDEPSTQTGSNLIVGGFGFGVSFMPSGQAFTGCGWFQIGCDFIEGAVDGIVESVQGGWDLITAYNECTDQHGWFSGALCADLIGREIVDGARKLSPRDILDECTANLAYCAGNVAGPGGVAGIARKILKAARAARAIPDPPNTPRAPSPVDDVLGDLDRGRQSNVRTVASDAQLQSVYDHLTRGASPISGRGSYDGTWVRRPDGVEIGLRSGSTSGGRTIDIRYPDGTIRKVHIE